MVSSNPARISFYLTFFLMLWCCQQSYGVQKICGDVLSEVLNNVCPNGMAKKEVKKSGGMPALDVEDYFSDMSDEPTYPIGFPFLSKFNEGWADLVAKTRRRRYNVGVADECCRKGCTYSELTSYCRK